jgi:hypothetical protein
MKWILNGFVYVNLGMFVNVNGEVNGSEVKWSEV